MPATVQSGVLRGARDAPVRVRLDAQSAVNLVARHAADAAGLELTPAEPALIERSDGSRAVARFRAAGRLRLGEREIALVLLVAPWDATDEDVLVGAPSLYRHGLLTVG